MQIHRAKKSLGQNFLRSKTVVYRMIKESKVLEGDIVLEIGPGKGVLTEVLLENKVKVIAVEKDDNLFEILKEKFSKQIEDGQFFLIHEDILNLSAEEIFSFAKLKAGSYKLIANIPYNITGEIIRKFLEEKNQPRLMALLVQKEVAERIVAHDKKESILSISVKAYGNPRKIMTVKRELFSPSPNVDSAVLLVENISTDFFNKNNISRENFFKIVKTGFAHKRKMISGNLKEIFKDKAGEIFTKTNISPKARAEDLNLSDWEKIVRTYLKNSE